MLEIDRNTTAEDNILLRGLGPILNREGALRRLTIHPSLPKDLTKRPQDARMRDLLRILDMHMPREIEGRLYETVDMMLYERYRQLNPSNPHTFATITGERLTYASPKMKPLAAMVSGLSGVGKSVALELCLRLFPQIVEHAGFPQIKGPHLQLVWLQAEIPQTGRAEDLARVLMQTYQTVTGSNRFESYLERERIARPYVALNEWVSVANGNFLGVLHLDEVQNLFKLATAESRRKSKSTDGRVDLRLVEDECLKWVLLLINSGLPVIFSGTPDGISALSTRLSTLQRTLALGSHELYPFKQNEFDFETFSGMLEKHQFASKALKFSPDVREALWQPTFGVPRLLMALWIGSNRLALESPKDILTVEHIAKARDLFFAPIKPAVDALRSGGIAGISRYQDLISSEPTYWPNFWNHMGSSRACT